MDESKQLIEKLCSYCVERIIDVPLINLKVNSDCYKFGVITFIPISEPYKKGKIDAWLKIENNCDKSEIPFIYSVARVNAPGDSTNAFNYAENKIKETLLILRGIGYPIQVEERTQIGILGEFPIYKNEFYISEKPKENYPMGDHSNTTIRLGPFIEAFDISGDLLNNSNSEIIARINEILRDEDKQELRDLPKKIIDGLKWIGEATKPDSISTRFVKLSFALETLIGGGPERITATLAERAAFLLESEYNNRKEMDRKVRILYGKRSSIVHGDSPDISENDLIEFGKLVRRIAFSLLMNLEKIKTIADLQNWIIEQKYS